jgi:hypothetical protein
MNRTTRTLFLSLLLVVFAGSGAAALAAQEPPPEVAPVLAPDTLQAAPSVLRPDPWGSEGLTLVTPRGAFVRSLLVPGWGHMRANAPGRAGFYVAAQGGSYWMLAKSLLRQRSAQRYLDAERGLVESELRLRGISSPDSLSLLADRDPRVARWDELVEIRGEQVEDWIALSAFLALLGATDALVAAHMADFPTPLSFRVGPAPGRGGWEFRVGLPFRGSP